VTRDSTKTRKYSTEEGKREYKKKGETGGDGLLREEGSPDLFYSEGTIFMNWEGPTEMERGPDEG